MRENLLNVNSKKKRTEPREIIYKVCRFVIHVRQKIPGGNAKWNNLMNLKTWFSFQKDGFVCPSTPDIPKSSHQNVENKNLVKYKGKFLICFKFFE